MKSLIEIEKDVKLKAQLINAPEIYIPTFGSSEGSARPHIEVGSNGYNFVVSERNIEHKRVSTFDYDLLMYLIFEGITFEMACNLELENRIENKDFRIQLFKIQEELIGKIDDVFCKNLKTKRDKLLKNF